MRMEMLGFSLLVFMSMYYIKKINEATFTAQGMFRESVSITRLYDTRLSRVETAVQEVPEMRREIREIRDMLMGRE